MRTKYLLFATQFRSKNSFPVADREHRKNDALRDHGEADGLSRTTAPEVPNRAVPSVTCPRSSNFWDSLDSRTFNAATPASSRQPNSSLLGVLLEQPRLGVAAATGSPTFQMPITRQWERHLKIPSPFLGTNRRTRDNTTLRRVPRRSGMGTRAPHSRLNALPYRA